MDEKTKKTLKSLNTHAFEIVRHYEELCRPRKVIVFSDSTDHMKKIRDNAMEKGEEERLETEGHTVHFDGINDQGRDVKNTVVLLPKGQRISKSVVTGEREEKLKEIEGLLSGIMSGKDMYVRFYCLGPKGSRFSIPAMQITDSAYVLHSEDILYRQGYQEFKTCEEHFFHFIHSSGELEGGKSKNIDKRRIYIDLVGNRVFTINNQYAGNSCGLKKLALRLAIKKSHSEDWLCEHMLIMGIRPEGKARVTYFTGAFPSACGKTSTAMVPGQLIIGDDIAYIRAGENGLAYAANVEQGIFGIIEDINPRDDPLIFKALTTPRELIFSNVLVSDNRPYWNGMGMDMPASGKNHSGEWKTGKKDPAGKDISPAHKNARFTMRIKELKNADPKIDDPNGVPIMGMIYGGRDSDTNPPVLETFSWSHGVFVGAALESETTAATIGEIGVRKHDPMANMDFMVIPLGLYIENHLKFGEELDIPPKIFATNYFLKEDGHWMNDKRDKSVWLHWMEGRVHSEFDAIETPIGFIPSYEDLKELFNTVMGKDYPKSDYEKQFSIRISKLLERLERIEAIYKSEENVPEIFHMHIDQQRKRLLLAREKHKKDEIKPSML